MNSNGVCSDGGEYVKYCAILAPTLCQCCFYFTVLQPDPCLHHHIPYIQAVPSEIQNIQVLGWALPTPWVWAVAMPVHLAVSAAAVLAPCLLVPVLNEL